MNEEELKAAADAVHQVADKHNVGWYFNQQNYEEIATAACSAYIVAHAKALAERAEAAKAASHPNQTPLKKEEPNG